MHRICNRNDNHTGHSPDQWSKEWDHIRDTYDHADEQDDENGAQQLRLLSSAAYPRGLRVRDVSLRYDSTSGIFTVTLQVGTVDSTLAETDFEVRRLNHT